jgi:hypothetical protein
LQRHDLHVRIAHLIDALDDAHDAIHVIGAVGDDENVRRRIGGEVAVLRNERPQNRHELRGVHALHRDHLRHDFIGA